MSPYSSSVMIGYIAFNQSILFLSTFLTAGLGVQEGVRSGAISLDLIRPVNFFLYTISQEAGRIAYNFFYRSLPIGLIFALTVGFSYPHHFVTYLWTFFSIALAAYIGLSLYYMVGISSVWTTEVRWAHFLNITLISGTCRSGIRLKSSKRCIKCMTVPIELHYCAMTTCWDWESFWKHQSENFPWGNGCGLIWRLPFCTIRDPVSG